MSSSLYSLVFTLVLFAECSTLWANMALPAGTVSEETSEQESLSSMLGDDAVSDGSAGTLPSRRHPTMDGRLADEEGRKRILILPDVGLRGSSRSDLRSGLARAFPLLSLPNTDRATRGLHLQDLHRKADDVNPVGRRDLDGKLLRCMIGRVYRPCWQS
ncbi:pro-MCH [Chanos chanos]|uniref:Pro-MCH n=1 Tax=Chanos chanos TaxID=29144 RepID=A0A6J2WNI8_CHACN|nr:pro-MCH [Chanos chanos]